MKLTPAPPPVDSSRALYFASPRQYADHLVTLGESSVAMDWRFWGDNSSRPAPDVVKFCKRVFGDTFTVAYYQHSTITEWDGSAASEHSTPRGVWPVFDFYTRKLDDFVWMLENPWGENGYYLNADVPVSQRPVPGQPHRVWVAGIPPATDPLYGSFSALMSWAKANFDVEIYIWSPFAFPAALNTPCDGIAFNPGVKFFGGELITQYGRGVSFNNLDDLRSVERHLAELGYTAEELYHPNRWSAPQATYQIAATRFAARYWDYHGHAATVADASRRPDLSELDLADFISEVVAKKVHAHGLPKEIK